MKDEENSLTPESTHLLIGLVLGAGLTGLTAIGVGVLIYVVQKLAQ